MLLPSIIKLELNDGDIRSTVRCIRTALALSLTCEELHAELTSAIYAGRTLTIHTPAANAAFAVSKFISQIGTTNAQLLRSLDIDIGERLFFCRPECQQEAIETALALIKPRYQLLPHCKLTLTFRVMLDVAERSLELSLNPRDRDTLRESILACRNLLTKARKGNTALMKGPKATRHMSRSIQKIQNVEAVLIGV